MKKFMIFIMIMAMAFSSTHAFAEDMWQAAESQEYGKKAGGMLGRGLLNAASCFVDLIVQTVEGTKQGPPVVGTLAGLGGGAACTVLRAGSGVVDVATFWVPGFNGIPVSKSYYNCLDFEEAAPVADASEFVKPGEYQAPAAAPAPAPVEKAHDPTEYVKK